MILWQSKEVLFPLFCQMWAVMNVYLSYFILLAPAIFNLHVGLTMKLSSKCLTCFPLPIYPVPGEGGVLTCWYIWGCAFKMFCFVLLFFLFCFFKKNRKIFFFKEKSEEIGLLFFFFKKSYIDMGTYFWKIKRWRHIPEQSKSKYPPPGFSVMWWSPWWI